MSSGDLRNAFAWEVVTASRLESGGDFAGAIQTLENFWQQHRTEDHDGWLRSAVTFQQADIIKNSGDLPGALKAFLSVNAKPEDRFFYLLLAQCLAKTLDELGETQEAFNELSKRLSEVRGTPGKEDLGIVTLYVDLATRLGQNLPPHHRDLIRDTVRAWEIPLTDTESQNADSLLAPLTAANAKLRKLAASQRRG